MGAVRVAILSVWALTQCLSMRVLITASNATQREPHGTSLSDCANWDVDMFAPPTDQWCNIRMYKCSTTPSMVPWWAINAWGVANANLGDVTWAAAGKKLGSIMTCAQYGEELQVWRVQVKRALMQQDPPPKYSQCNNGVCGCGLDGSHCHDGPGGLKPVTTFGWRYKDQKDKEAKNSKRQFSLPAESRTTEWKDLCLERVVPVECVKSTLKTQSGEKTFDIKDDMAEVAAIFQRDVLEKPISGCESLSTVNECKGSLW